MLPLPVKPQPTTISVPAGSLRRSTDAHGLFIVQGYSFAFDNVERCANATGGGPDAQALADVMSEAWIAFVKTGNPNHKGMPKWDPVASGKVNTMIFDTKVEQATNFASGADRNVRGVARLTFAASPNCSGRGAFTDDHAARLRALPACPGMDADSLRNLRDTPIFAILLSVNHHYPNSWRILNAPGEWPLCFVFAVHGVSFCSCGQLFLASWRSNRPCGLTPCTSRLPQKLLLPLRPAAQACRRTC